MLVPENCDGFQATVSTLLSLDKNEVSFYAFSLSEDLCICLLLKNFGKCMSEADI
jgi:hypothetical protein